MKSKATHAASCMDGIAWICIFRHIHSCFWKTALGLLVKAAQRGMRRQSKVHRRYTHISDSVESLCTVKNFSVEGKP